MKNCKIFLSWLMIFALIVGMGIFPTAAVYAADTASLQAESTSPQLILPEKVNAGEEFTITLTDSQGKPLTGKWIILEYGNNYLGLTDENGELKAKINKAGIQKIIAAETNEYGNPELNENGNIKEIISKNININLPDINISCSKNTVNPGESFTVSVTADRQPLQGVPVKFGYYQYENLDDTGNSAFQLETTDINGKADVSVDAPPGEYKLFVVYSNENYIAKTITIASDSPYSATRVEPGLDTDCDNASTAVLDGKVYIFKQNEIRCFDPVNNIVNKMENKQESLPWSGDRFFTGVSNGEIYIFGRISNENSTNKIEVFKYDVDNNSVTDIGQLPKFTDGNITYYDFLNYSSCSIDGKIYFPLRYEYYKDTPDDKKFSTEIIKFDPSNMQKTESVVQICGEDENYWKFTDCSITAVADKIYIFGGNENPDILKIDLAAKTKSVESVAKFMPICKSSGGTINGNIYLFGGAIFTSGYGFYSTLGNTYHIFKFDPVSNAIERVSYLPSQKVNASVASINDKIYVFGGSGTKDIIQFKNDSNIHIQISSENKINTTPVPTVEPKNEATVYIRVEGYNKTILPRQKIKTDIFDLNPYLSKPSGSSSASSAGWGIDRFKYPTVAHALVEALNSTNIPFELQDYGWSLYISMINGEREFDHGGSSGWMYRVNDKMPNVGCQDTEIKDGDELVWYYGTGFDTVYSKLGTDKTAAVSGEEVTITLNGIKTDLSVESGTTSSEPVSGATILVNDEPYKIGETFLTTDGKGKATIKFDKPGSYVLSADKLDSLGQQMLVRPQPVTIAVTPKLTEVNKSPLETAISFANSNKSSVKVSLDGSDIETAQKWVTQEIMTAYETAIATAQGIFSKTDASQAEVDQAVTNLETASAVFDNAKKPGAKVAVSKAVSIRVEGISSTIIKTGENYTTQKLTVYEAVYELLTNNNIPIVASDTQYGKYVSSINNVTAGAFGGYDGWMYAVNNIEASVSMDACSINNGDNIVVYYGGFSPQTYLPQIALSATNIVKGSNLTVSVQAAYFDWNTNSNVTVKISGAAIKLSGQTYTTDANGQAIITVPDTAGDYTLEISQNREDNYPLLVRTTQKITVIDFTSIGYKISRQAIVLALEKATNKLIEKFDDSSFNYQQHWMAIAIKGFDKSVHGSYLQAIKNGDMPAKNSGQYGKYILGILAAGGDPTNINGRNLLAELCQLSDMKNVNTEGGIYTTPFGLLALDAVNYEIPSNAGFTRDDIINKLITLASPTGGEDGVGFVLTALGKYYNEKPAVKAAVDKVVTAWADRQGENGGFGAGAWSTENNVNTAAQVLMGLSFNGKDPQSEQFTKAKGNLVSFILSLQNADGTFNWQKSNAGSISMATEQAAYALVQYLRQLDGRKSIYDFTEKDSEEPDITAPDNGGGTTPQTKKYVTLSVDKLTISKGYVISTVQAELQSGDTAWTLLKRELDKRGISCKYIWSEQYGSVYVQSIDGDGEFDHGSGSGWMYAVNNWYPDYGATKYTLKDGDKLLWRYTTNLGADLGEDLSKWGNSAGATTPGSQTPASAGQTVISPDDKTPASAGQTVTSPDDKTPTTDIPKDIQKNYTYKDESSISVWAYEAIGAATQKGFVSGNNGNFNPKGNITRAEFTKIMVSVLGLDIKTDKVINFTDVKEDNWFYPYVNSAYKAGIVKGSGSKFNPDDKITREQMAAIIIRAFGVKPIKPVTAIKDMNSVTDCFKTDVETIFALGLMVGNGNQFNPVDFATREMAVVVAMKAYDYKNGEYTKTSEVKKYIEETGALMLKTVSNPVVSSVGGEWTVLSLARSGIIVPNSYYEIYYENVEKKLKETSGKLHNVKYTEYDRVILALSAIGKDVTNAAGYDLTKPLADFNAVIKQGLNGPVWALIAFDSKGYQIPEDKSVTVQTTREMLVNYILSKEISGGGWSLTSETPADTDITAMVLQALSKYQDNKDVKAAIDRALNFLSSTQQSDGSFKGSWGDETSSESVAQVVVALTCLNIDPATDKRFIKNGRNPVSALLTFYVTGGGFKHTLNGELDAMATDQGMYALVAYERLASGQKPLYDMTDVKKVI